MSVRLAVGSVVLIGLAQMASTPRRWSDRGGPRATDEALIAIVDQATGPAGVVLIVGDGQWLGFQIGRPTLAVPARSFSGAAWDEPMIRGLVAKYQVRLIIVNKDPEGTAAVVFTERLRELPTPAWIREIGATPTATIYETLERAP